MRYSIITVNLNNKEGLRKTIESVINQSFQDFEFIIIDGGSTDGSIDVIKKYENKITYWISEPDKGVYNAMNKGICKAQGEYLNFMNSGDSFYDNTILEQLKNNSEDIYFGNAFRIELNKIEACVNIQSFYNLCAFLPIHQAMFFSKNIFLKRMYDESLKIVADWKLFLQSIYLDSCSHKHVDVTIANYEGGGISSDVNLVKNERSSVLKELLPPLIYNDYIVWTQLKAPIMFRISDLTKGYRMQFITDRIISLIIKLYGFRNKLFK